MACPTLRTCKLSEDSTIHIFTNTCYRIPIFHSGLTRFQLTICGIGEEVGNIDSSTSIHNEYLFLLRNELSVIKSIFSSL